MLVPYGNTKRIGVSEEEFKAAQEQVTTNTTTEGSDTIVTNDTNNSVDISTNGLLEGGEVEDDQSIGGSSLQSISPSK